MAIDLLAWATKGLFTTPVDIPDPEPTPEPTGVSYTFTPHMQQEDRYVNYMPLIQQEEVTHMKSKISQSETNTIVSTTQTHQSQQIKGRSI